MTADREALDGPVAWAVIDPADGRVKVATPDRNDAEASADSIGGEYVEPLYLSASPRPAEAEREEASLAPLRARAEALLAVADRATPGPWVAFGHGPSDGTVRANGDDGWPNDPVCFVGHNQTNQEGDARAIAALRDAPALIRDLLAALGEDLPAKESP